MREKCRKQQAPETVGVYYQGQSLHIWKRGEKVWAAPDHFMLAVEAVELYRTGAATFIRHSTCIIRFDLHAPMKDTEIVKCDRTGSVTVERERIHRSRGKLRDVSASPGERLMNRFVDSTCFDSGDRIAEEAINSWA
jgi:hypothetical protein